MTKAVTDLLFADALDRFAWDTPRGSDEMISRGENIR
jgi:hypothetical protein